MSTRSSSPNDAPPQHSAERPATHSSSASDEQGQGPSTEHKQELDRYAGEFAELVKRCPPRRHEPPHNWLSRLPDEAFEYFLAGISTFGQEAASPLQRRGRLYLLHAALVLLWIRWGKQKSRSKIRARPEESLQRTGRLAVLEYYRRAGVLAGYTADDWFDQPVGEWQVTLITAAADLQRIPHSDLREALRNRSVCELPLQQMRGLLKEGALPSVDAVSLN